MKKLKKLFAVMLSLIMVLAMGITSFAADSGTDKIFGTIDDTATITVNGIDNETGIQVNAYKVVEARYDGAGATFSGYNSLYPAVITQEMVKADLSTLTSDQLTSLANAVMADDTKTAIPLTNTTDTTTWTATVGAGTYLVLVSDTEAHSYNPMVVSAYYVNENGNTNISEGALTLTTTAANAKKSNAPTINKKITNSNGNDYGNSVEVNDIVNYEVTVTPIPSYTGSHPVFNVEDTLSNGLDFVTDENGNVVDPVVKVGTTTLTKDTDYTVSVDGRKMTINFVVGKAYKLNAYASQTLTIRYSAKVNKDAVLWDNVNTNTAKLNYTNDSKVDGNNTSAEKTTYTYTFDIGGEATGTNGIITKTGKDKNSEKPLDGAVFGLYKAGEGVTAETVATAADNAAYKTATSDTKGQIHFSQLKKGTYYLKELSAPDGYSVNTHVYTVTIDTTHKNDGTLDRWSVTIDGTTSTFALNNEGTWESVKNPTYIVNTTLSSLPSTGGIGTTIFTIVGCGIMIAAAGLFFASRRKENR
ncbi:SpaH/EbpB family LPXTG-anchored major pilin [Coprococcus sp. CLA-AA-H190]|uniref:SpaH/EbpB family LPXTG-anchored major pilin n=1 Tax=Coprococcus intestinihominis TaxID=3133154 RepID=A0ABV1B7P1_9FIRM